MIKRFNWAGMTQKDDSWLLADNSWPRTTFLWGKALRLRQDYAGQASKRSQDIKEIEEKVFMD